MLKLLSETKTDTANERYRIVCSGLRPRFGQRRWLYPILTELGRDQQGVIIVMFALMLPVLLGFIGLGVEVAYWFSKHRDLQAAADAAAIAGSYEVAEDRTSQTQTVALREAVNNGWVNTGANFAVNNPPTNTSFPTYLGDSDAVEVELTEQVTRMFTGWFMSDDVTINARAVGLSVVGATKACVLALGSANAARAIDVSGAAEVTMSGCTVATNSTDSSAADVIAGLTVDCVLSAGGVNGTATTTACSGAKENQPVVTDPYETAFDGPPDVTPVPGDFSPCGTLPASPISPSDSPFCSMSVSGALVMAAGTYYIDRGNLTLAGGDSIDATAGVTIVFGDSTGGSDCGGISITGNSDINITAPGPGDGEDFTGVAFYRNSDCDAGAEFKFAGNNDSTIVGAVYNPSGAIKLTGNGDVDGTCLQLIGDTVKITGSSDIGSNCTGVGTVDVVAGGKGSLVE